MKNSPSLQSKPPVNGLNSGYRSPEPPNTGGTGPSVTDPPEPTDGITILIRLWRNGPVSVKSSLAREKAAAFAALASVGLITTRIAQIEFSNSWHITPSGLDAVFSALGLYHEDHAADTTPPNSTLH